MASSFNHEHFRCNFQNWMTQQHQDLDELERALSINSAITDADLNELREKSIRHFEDYSERRAMMAKHDPPCFMSPPWCSAFENAFMWVGGCRPSLAIRLLYYVCGAELDDQLEGFLRGERKGNLAELSAPQMQMINDLHCKIIKEENMFAARIASIQEEIADEPLAAMVAKGTAGRVGEWSAEVERAIAVQSESLAEVVLEADRLRMETMKKVLGILTPLQAVDFLIATKKLHISMHSWGMRRECLSASASASASASEQSSN